VVGTTALAAAAFAGGAYAASQEPSMSGRQAFLNDVAKRLKVTPAQLSSALNGAFKDQLDAAVKAGKLTQAQANAIEQSAQRAGAPPAFGLLPGGPRGFGPVAKAGEGGRIVAGETDRRACRA